MFFLCLKYLFQIFVKLSGKSCIQLRTVSLIRFHIGFLKFFFFSEKIHLFSTLDLPRGRLSDPLNTDEYHGNARNFNLELGTIMIWYFCTFQENTYNRKHPWNDRKGMLSSNSKYWFWIPYDRFSADIGSRKRLHFLISRTCSKTSFLWMFVTLFLVYFIRGPSRTMKRDKTPQTSLGMARQLVLLKRFGQAAKPFGAIDQKNAQFCWESIMEFRGVGDGNSASR